MEVATTLLEVAEGSNTSAAAPAGAAGGAGGGGGGTQTEDVKAFATLVRGGGV